MNSPIDAQKSTNEFGLRIDMLTRSSFHRQIATLRESRLLLEEVDTFRDLPEHNFGMKLQNYEFAQSHGVTIPYVRSSWSCVDEIDLADLEGRFVLKSDEGSSGTGVLVLERSGADTFKVVGTDVFMSQSEIRGKFRQLLKEGRIDGIFFSEGYIKPNAELDEIPEDIKIYMAYGEVLQTLVRSVPRLRDFDAVKVRYFDDFGQDLGCVAAGMNYDNSIELPQRYDDMLDIARHLSIAAGVPFIRVDLYESADKVIFGELTPSPGGPQLYRPDHDKLMGEKWVKASLRLERDIVRGDRLPGILYGTESVQNLYPPKNGYVNDDRDPIEKSVSSCPVCSKAK